MIKISLLLIAILLIQVFCQEENGEIETPTETDACSGYTKDDENKICLGEENSLLEKCIYNDNEDSCTVSIKSCEEVRNFDEKIASKEDCEAIEVTNGYCIQTSTGCSPITTCGHEDDFLITSQTTCDNLGVSDDYHQCVLTGNRCIEDDKSCSEFLNDNTVTSAICSKLKVQMDIFAY